ncbi:hypothetical protein BD413DRAFT_616888 [Trametes elegans]|nr:hypothetical protein BD413DRAFT_616888 [Trametes elegans]
MSDTDTESTPDRDFVPSPTPVDYEGDGDSDEEYAVERIVGQSVDGFGVVRYEVKWAEGWHRPDGTDTTWQRKGEDPAVDALIEAWDARQAQRRAQRAARSPAVDVRVAPHEMLHEDRTVCELVCAREELRAAWPEPEGPLGWDRTWKWKRKAYWRCRRKWRSESERYWTLVGKQGGLCFLVERVGLEGLVQGGVRPEVGVAHGCRRIAAGHAAQTVTSPVDSDAEVMETPPPPPPPRLQQRSALERKWKARLAGSAPVSFVNEVNGEAVPFLVDDFQYIERGYVRADDVPGIQESTNCLVNCDCDFVCEDAAVCQCQDPSELKDEDGESTYAYTPERLFNFLLPPGMEVIECNESCYCEQDCPNRVAQRPRDVPIEVFRTYDCGWGARATVPVPRGKVLGIYTGQLITREEADKRIDLRRSYIFDLDVREGGDEDEDDEDEGVKKYSVDGHAYGNWTRFVNHSCEPNMRVFPVVWDTIPEFNQPYLAFVATEDIPARTELTIDYDPKAGEDARLARLQKAKGRAGHASDMPEGARPCMCGTDRCRGWVRV